MLCTKQIHKFVQNLNIPTHRLAGALLVGNFGIYSYLTVLWWGLPVVLLRCNTITQSAVIFLKLRYRTDI